MPAVFGQLEPLPGVAYTGTMSTADIYPDHVGIGGIRTQDRALPAFGDATAAAAQRSLDVANVQRGLLGTPSGWIVVLILGLIVAAWYYK
jgi:hypothetical protein